MRHKQIKISFESDVKKDDVKKIITLNNKFRQRIMANVLQENQMKRVYKKGKRRKNKIKGIKIALNE